MHKITQHPGAHIAAILARHDVKRRDAAAAMGIQESTLSRYCAGKMTLSVDLAKKISVYLSLCPAELLSRQAEYELSLLEAEHYKHIKPLKILT